MSSVRGRGAHRVVALVVASVIVLAGATGRLAHAQHKPEGEMRWALYVTFPPTWLDPGEVTGIITPFWVIYAIHDALVKPMPGNLMAPSLAESWTVSADQRVYEFKLREGVKFHNGDPLTAEDVKFSFLRAKGSKILRDKVKEVEAAGPTRVRFHLHEPWPDFMTFYGTLVGAAGWIVPKKYVEQVGDDGFRKQPVGLGPYRFVSHTPGVELVLEAYEGYWRKMPHVKRLVFKMVPEATTRLAMLKRGEIDLAYLLDAPMAQDVKRDPNFKLVFSGAIGVFYLDFFDQWDPKSPWHDRRVRLASVLAIDTRAINDAENLGASRLTGSLAPRKFEFTLPSSRIRTIPRARSNSWPRRATPTASTPGTCIRTRPTRRWGRRSRDTWARWASARRSGRWSEPPSCRRGAARSSRGCVSASTPSTATPPRGCRSSCRAAGCSRGAPIPTWTRSTSSSRASSTARSARRCCTGSSSSSTNGCGSDRSTSTSGRARWGRGCRIPRSC